MKGYFQREEKGLDVQFRVVGKVSEKREYLRGSQKPEWQASGRMAGGRKGEASRTKEGLPSTRAASAKTPCEPTRSVQEVLQLNATGTQSGRNSEWVSGEGTDRTGKSSRGCLTKP